MFKNIAAFVGTVLTCVAMGAQPTAYTGEPTKVQSIEGITEYRLDNGLKVLLYPDDSKPTVTVNLTVLVGSRHEGYGEAGMAHLLEHMLFKGTPLHGQIPKLLQERGAEFNGTTWLDRTNYFETLPATDENLEFAIRLESDRMVNSYVRQEDLFSEMTVVRNEFERGENSPEALLDQRIVAVAFDWHNYGKSTIGNRADIERVPIGNLQAFYKKHYQPDNAALIVAGKFEPATALKYITKYFGSLPKSKRKLDRTYTEEPPQDGERTVVLRRVGDVGIVGAAYHVPSGSHGDIAPLDVLAEILGDSPSGRLYKGLVETKKATEVSAGVSSWHDAGLFQVQAEVRQKDQLEAVRDAMLEITESVGRHSPTQADVDRARQRILKARELLATNTTRLAIQLSEWAAQGDWRLYFLHRDRIEKVTPADVKRVAEKYFKRSNRTVGMFIPTPSAERTPVPPSPNVAKLLDGYRGRQEVASGESFDVAPLAIEKRVRRLELPEGVKIALLPKKTRGEAVTMRITLRYGDLENLKGYEAATDMLPELMARGTRKHSREKLEDELDKNRAVLAPAGDVGYVRFDVVTKRQYLPAVLDLVRQVLREPAIAPDEFELLRRQQLAQLEQQITDPTALAMTRLRRTVSPYPQGDVRYVPTIDEQIRRAKELSVDEVKRLYSDFVGAQAGEIALVGDFDSELVMKEIKKIFGGWTASKPYERIERLAFDKVRGGHQQIVTPDKANAVYMAAEVYPLSDADADYAPLVIGNYVLGSGALSSRLGERVRQKEGLSYGVGSFLSAESLDPRTSLTIFAICNPQNTDKVVAVIAEEFQRLIAGGIHDDELNRAKRGYLEQQRVSRASDQRLVGTLADLLYTGRTMQYYADLERTIERLTASQVDGVVKKYFQPARLSVVTAGDFASLAKDPKGSREAKRQ